MGKPQWRNGRRGRLKICCPQGRAGSSPAWGTIKIKDLTKIQTPKRVANDFGPFVLDSTLYNTLPNTPCNGCNTVFTESSQLAGPSASFLVGIWIFTLSKNTRPPACPILMPSFRHSVGSAAGKLFARIGRACPVSAGFSKRSFRRAASTFLIGCPGAEAAETFRGRLHHSLAVF